MFLSRQDIYDWEFVSLSRDDGGPFGVCCCVGLMDAGCSSGCVLFENCTVDASIFVVSNEERTVDALAPGADEGRRRLR